MRTACAIACAAIVSLGPARAWAANCFVSTTGVAFGSYDPLSAAPLDGSGSITLSCNGWITLAYVMLSAGSSGDTGARRMASGADRLRYNVYRDAALSRIWGDDGAYPGVWVSAPPKVTLPLYGRIPAGQDVAGGTYTDTITVTVDFY